MHSSAKVIQTCNNKLQKMIVIKLIKAKKKYMPSGALPYSWPVLLVLFGYIYATI